MLTQKIEEAIGAGVVLRIRYFGGSSPGSEREISPISLSGEKVRARCLLKNVVKTFDLTKMELVVSGEESVLAKNQTIVDPIFSTLQEIFESRRSYFEDLGWTIMLEENKLSLHRTFKNGRLIKTPDVALNFEEFSPDMIIREENINPRARPWVVRAKNKDTKTFGLFPKAQSLFNELAKELAP